MLKFIDQNQSYIDSTGNRDTKQKLDHYFVIKSDKLEFEFLDVSHDPAVLKAHKT